MTTLQKSRNTEAIFKDLGATSAVVIPAYIATRWATEAEAVKAYHVALRAGMMPDAVRESPAEDGWIMSATW